MHPVKTNVETQLGGPARARTVRYDKKHQTAPIRRLTSRTQRVFHFFLLLALLAIPTAHHSYTNQDPFKARQHPRHRYDTAQTPPTPDARGPSPALLARSTARPLENALDIPKLVAGLCTRREYNVHSSIQNASFSTYITHGIPLTTTKRILTDPERRLTTHLKNLTPHPHAAYEHYNQIRVGIVEITPGPRKLTFSMYITRGIPPTETHRSLTDPKKQDQQIQIRVAIVDITPTPAQLLPVHCFPSPEPRRMDATMTFPPRPAAKQKRVTLFAGTINEDGHPAGQVTHLLHVREPRRKDKPDNLCTRQQIRCGYPGPVLIETEKRNGYPTANKKNPDLNTLKANANTNGTNHTMLDERTSQDNRNTKTNSCAPNGNRKLQESGGARAVPQPDIILRFCKNLKTGVLQTSRETPGKTFTMNMTVTTMNETGQSTANEMTRDTTSKENAKSEHTKNRVNATTHLHRRPLHGLKRMAERMGRAYSHTHTTPSNHTTLTTQPHHTTLTTQPAFTEQEDPHNHATFTHLAVRQIIPDLLPPCDDNLFICQSYRSLNTLTGQNTLVSQIRLSNTQTYRTTHTQPPPAYTSPFLPTHLYSRPSSTQTHVNILTGQDYLTNTCGACMTTHGGEKTCGQWGMQCDDQNRWHARLEKTWNNTYSRHPECTSGRRERRAAGLDEPGSSTHLKPPEQAPHHGNTPGPTHTKNRLDTTTQLHRHPLHRLKIIEDTGRIVVGFLHVMTTSYTHGLMGGMPNTGDLTHELTHITHALGLIIRAMAQLATLLATVGIPIYTGHVLTSTLTHTHTSMKHRDPKELHRMSRERICHLYPHIPLPRSTKRATRTQHARNPDAHRTIGWAFYMATQKCRITMTRLKHIARVSTHTTTQCTTLSNIVSATLMRMLLHLKHAYTTYWEVQHAIGTRLYELTQPITRCYANHTTPRNRQQGETTPQRATPPPFVFAFVFGDTPSTTIVNNTHTITWTHTQSSTQTYTHTQAPTEKHEHEHTYTGEGETGEQGSLQHAGKHRWHRWLEGIWTGTHPELPEPASGREEQQAAELVGPGTSTHLRLPELSSGGGEQQTADHDERTNIGQAIVEQREQRTEVRIQITGNHEHVQTMTPRLDTDYSRCTHIRQAAVERQIHRGRFRMQATRHAESTVTHRLIHAYTQLRTGRDIFCKERAGVG